MRRLVEDAVRAVCDLPRPGLWLCIDHVEFTGRVPASIRVRATLHFTAAGSPFCCGEPMCHLGFGEEQLRAIGEHVRRTMGIRQNVSVEFVDLLPSYHADVRFHYGEE